MHIYWLTFPTLLVLWLLRIPSPVGFAHVISFTTHKTLCGPRGACLITDNATLAKKIDKAVFPGEQGGPHIHAIAALALTFKIAKSKSLKHYKTKLLKIALY